MQFRCQMSWREDFPTIRALVCNLGEDILGYEILETNPYVDRIVILSQLPGIHEA